MASVLSRGHSPIIVSTTSSATQYGMAGSHRPHPTPGPTLEQIACPAHLRVAWERVHSNDGAPGPDRVTVTAYAWFAGLRLAWLGWLLRSGWYRPGPLRPVDIPKKSGGTRRLEVPSVRDRIVGTALNLALSPLYERRFLSTSHGYRPHRGVETALAAVRRIAAQGFCWIVDADIRSCFPSMDQNRVLALLAEDLEDKRVVSLIDRLLGSSVPWLLRIFGRRRGCPQGSPLSPLLCNRLLHELDCEVSRAGFRMIRYADDFVVLCRTRDEAVRAREAIAAYLRDTLDLALHPEKTRLIPARELHFLGQDVFGVPGASRQSSGPFDWAMRWIRGLLRA